MHTKFSRFKLFIAVRWVQLSETESKHNISNEFFLILEKWQFLFSIVLIVGIIHFKRQILTYYVRGKRSFIDSALIYRLLSAEDENIL